MPSVTGWFMGGERFQDSCLITEETIRDFKACIPLAPLHNPANLKGLLAMQNLLPDVPQVAVFDTAFHQTMPDFAYMYASPTHFIKSTVSADMASMDGATSMLPGGPARSSV